jgi:hypothetical protein
MPAASRLSSFRFGNLPGEIRNKVYHELLCDFKLRPNTCVDERLPIEDALDGSILRTSKAIYYEAYDYMVKTNRFVQVTFIQGTFLSTIFSCLQVPTVWWGETEAMKFQGHVLEVDLKHRNPEDVGETYPRQWTFMMRHRYMDKFCRALMDAYTSDPRFGENVQISIRMAPALDVVPQSMHSASFDAFFSDNVQRMILEPCKMILRGFRSLEMQDHIDEVLALAVQDDIMQDRWSDPKQILTELKAMKLEGKALFQQHKISQSVRAWMYTSFSIQTMFNSSSWPALSSYDDEQFIPQLAEIFFLVALNLAHLFLKDERVPVRTAAYFLLNANESLAMDHWKQRYQYQPSNQHLAKLEYRLAVVLRRQAVPGSQHRALEYIDNALQLQPQDKVLMEERDKIVAWTRDSG